VLLLVLVLVLLLVLGNDIFKMPTSKLPLLK
jgi:hypothetical protein